MGCLTGCCCCGREDDEHEYASSAQTPRQTWNPAGKGRRLSRAAGGGGGGSGASARRRCTDLPCLIFFLAFLTAMALIGVLAWSSGDWARFVNGADSAGNTCGRKNRALTLSTDDNSQELTRVPRSGGDMRNKSFLFPLDATRPWESQWICVAGCPNQPILDVASLRNFGYTNSSLCTVDASLIDSNAASQPQTCPRLPVMPAVPVLNRCVPRDLLATGEAAVRQIVQLVHAQPIMARVAGVLRRFSPLIPRLALVATVASILVLLLLSVIASIAVYAIYGLVILVTGGVSGFAWYAWFVKQSGHSAELFKFVGGADLLRRATVEQLLYAAIACTATTLFIWLLLWCVAPRGRLLVQLFTETGRALRARPSLLLLPVFSAAALVTVFGYGALVAGLLYSGGEPYLRKVNYTMDGIERRTLVYQVVSWRLSNQQRYILYLHAIGVVWLAEFVLAAQRMLVAVTVAGWYFSRDTGGSDSKPERMPNLCAAVCNLVRYHVGTLALGSAIITAIKIPRWIVLYVYAKARDATGLTKCLLGWAIGCLAALERLLVYVHHNAYTVTAITGASFCPAAKMAVNILLDNAVDVAMVNTLGRLILLLVKLTVAGTTAGAALWTLSRQDANPELEAEAPTGWVVVVAFVGGYLLASCCCIVLDMVLDTLFLCFAEQRDIAIKSGHTPRSPASPQFRAAAEEQALMRKKMHGSGKDARNGEDESLVMRGMTTTAMRTP